MSRLVEAIARVPALRRAGSLVTSRVKRWSVDVAVAGFPKCGNTWSSALLRQLVIERFALPQASFGRLFVSDLGALPVTPLQLPRGIPRLYHTHFLPLPMRDDLGGISEALAPFRRTKMIVLIRDPKDALTSYYLWAVRRMALPDAPPRIEEFVRGPRYGIAKFIGYYNLIAENRRGGAPTRVISYERRWADPIDSLAGDAAFCGLGDLGSAAIARVAAQYDFAHMREMERETTAETALLRPLYHVASDDPDAAFVRKGGSGNWREHMPRDLAAEIDADVAARLDPLFRDTLDLPLRSGGRRGPG